MLDKSVTKDDHGHVEVQEIIEKDDEISAQPVSTTRQTVSHFRIYIQLSKSHFF